MKIYHCWTPDKWPDNITPEIRQNYEVIDVVPKHDFDYARMIFENWGKDDFINIEHDLVVNLNHVRELHNCAFPFCVYAYKIHKATTGLDYSVYAHRVITLVPVWEQLTNMEPVKLNLRKERWLEEREEYCTFPALGFLKLSKVVQQAALEHTNNQIKNLMSTVYNKVDHVMSLVLLDMGMKCHVHWPEVEHLHK